jgi:SAM-dependent methyltransferase
MGGSQLAVSTGVRTEGCPICFSKSWGEIYRFEDERHYVVGCQGCGAQTLLPYPRPEETSALYDDWHTTRTPDDKVDFLIDRHVELFHALQRDIDFDLRHGSFLEVGFGNGTSPLGAAKFGMGEVYGVDLDPENVADTERRARAKNLRVQVWRGDAVTDLGQGRYRLVKASQLIEHLTNPAEFIESIARRQDCGDYLYLECPNNAAAFLLLKNALRRRFGRMDFYNALKIHLHLWGFNPRSMSELLTGHGYEIVFCCARRLRHPYFHPENLLWYASVWTGMIEAIRLRRPYPLLKSMIGAFDFVASLAGRGMELTALARKT